MAGKSPESGVGSAGLAEVGVAGVVAIAAFKFGGADFVRDAAVAVSNIDYGDNIKDLGMAVTGVTAVVYGGSRLLSSKIEAANAVTDRRKAALTLAGVGLGIWAAGSLADGLTNSGADSSEMTPVTNTLVMPDSSAEDSVVDTILDTPPEATTVTVNTGSEGRFLVTPGGQPCEVYLPFNNAPDLAENLKLVQAALKTEAERIGDEALDPGPVDGMQGDMTNSALIHWRTQYLNAPEGEIFNASQCDGLPTLVDSDLSTPVIP